MNDYVIVSDATSDLPMDIIKKYDIHIIPMGIDIDNKEYTHYADERELSIEDFYAGLKAGAISHTSQITPVVFSDYFTGLLKQNLDIMYIAFSSGLSGTYNTAKMVTEGLSEEFPDSKIYCIDSLCASIGEGLLVYQAAMQKQKGLNITELKEWIEENKLRIRHWFTVKDLFYLKRGGRVTSIEAVVGTALKIRPVLSMDGQGKLVVTSKIRGSRAELDFLLDKLISEGVDLTSQAVIIGHGDNLEHAKELEMLLRSKSVVNDIIISKIGPVIGTHTGPGMLALTFIGTNI